MQYRKLGASNIEVSAVAFGAWAIGGWMWGGTEEQDAIHAIHAALDHGITLIDTAPMYGYGRSEELVGRAIRGRRASVVLATKCGLVWDRNDGELFFHADDAGIAAGGGKFRVYKNLRPASIRRELEASLGRLGTDYVDLLQTHWQDATTPIAETVAELHRLRDEGKIRAIGVSNANLEQLRSYGPIASDQERFSMLDRGIQHNGALDYCRQHHVAMFPYSPLANGLLTGTLDPDRRYNPGDLRADNPRFQPARVRAVNAALSQLAPLVQRQDVSIAQLVIAWTMAQPGITSVLCGARNAMQAAENARAADVTLAPDELATIDAVAEILAAAA